MSGKDFLKRNVSITFVVHSWTTFSLLTSTGSRAVSIARYSVKYTKYTEGNGVLQLSSAAQNTIAPVRNLCTYQE